MHVLQRIAVQADSADMAFRTVKDGLESELGSDMYATNTWFDWFVTGGGRWNPNEASQYDDNDQSMTISYKDNPEEFINTVNEAIEGRVAEFNQYRKTFNEKSSDINAYLDKYTGNTEYSFELYELNKMIEMLQGNWDFNSYFYDMHNASTNPRHMLDNLNDSWYIVFVDFHF
jgi:hypothetical protein